MKISVQLLIVILLAVTTSARPMVFGNFVNDYNDLSQSQKDKLAKFENMEQGNSATIIPTTNNPTQPTINDVSNVNFGTPNQTNNMPQDISSALAAGREAIKDAMTAASNIRWKRMVFDNFVDDSNGLSQSQQDKLAQFEAIERGQGPISQ
ncbi:hypothetical protein TWF481_010455 [Arthrobotrys musiformis]|uniref:Uncharacterized protein n=1 Tax=Arthrobotrys musiformis TaxID=47236 RepID=A0AAV9W2U4_9PEZI